MIYVYIIPHLFNTVEKGTSQVNSKTATPPEVAMDVSNNGARREKWPGSESTGPEHLPNTKRQAGARPLPQNERAAG